MWLLVIAAIAIALLYESSSSSDGAGSGPVSGWAQTVADVFSKFENSNPAYNNPMAIQGTGDTGQTAPNGLGIFSSAEAGVSAGIRLVESYASRFPDLTIRQFIARYTTGKVDGSSASIDNETNMLGDALGVDPDETTLGDLVGDDSGDP